MIIAKPRCKELHCVQPFSACTNIAAICKHGIKSALFNIFTFLDYVCGLHGQTIHNYMVTNNII